MKRQFLLFLLLIGSSFGFSQKFEFAPVGAKWRFYVQSPSIPYWTSGYGTVESIKDTLIDGKVCKKLQDETIFYQNINDSIFLFDTSEDKFKLLYDFSAEQGDTFFCEACNADVTIDTVFQLNIFGENRKVQEYSTNATSSSCCWGKTKIIEGVGSLDGYFKTSPCLADGISIYYLDCYEDNSNSYICPLISVEDYAYEMLTSISPSVFESNITVEIDQNSLLKSITLSLFDINGKEIYRENAHSSSIDLSHLDSGIYLAVFTLSSGERIKTQKIIKR